MKDNLKDKWVYSRIISIEPINRKDAKYYTKNCDICKEFYNTKEKLFLLMKRTFQTTEDLKSNNLHNAVIDTHIFTLKELNTLFNKFALRDIKGVF